MERTAPPVASALADERNKAVYHVHNIIPGDELIHEILRKCHGLSLLSLSLAGICGNHTKNRTGKKPTVIKYTPSFLNFLFFSQTF